MRTPCGGGRAGCGRAHAVPLVIPSAEGVKRVSRDAASSSGCAPAVAAGAVTPAMTRRVVPSGGGKTDGETRQGSKGKGRRGETGGGRQETTAGDASPPATADPPYNRQRMSGAAACSGTSGRGERPSERWLADDAVPTADRGHDRAIHSTTTWATPKSPPPGRCSSSPCAAVLYVCTVQSDCP